LHRSEFNRKKTRRRHRTTQASKGKKRGVHVNPQKLRLLKTSSWRKGRDAEGGQKRMTEGGRTYDRRKRKPGIIRNYAKPTRILSGEFLRRKGIGGRPIYSKEHQLGGKGKRLGLPYG